MAKKKSRPELPLIAQRVRQARKEKNLTQTELGRLVGIGQSGVATLERGEIRRPTRLMELSQVLGKSEQWLLGKVETDQWPVNPFGAIYAELMEVPVDGVLETGAYRSVDAFEDAMPAASIQVAKDPRFPTAKRVAFLNNDDLDLVHIHKGDMVIGVDFAQSGLPLRDNMLVVVQISHAGGMTAERSVRKVATFRNRIELQSCASRRPRETVEIGTGHDYTGKVSTKDGREIRILAVVTRVQKEIPV